MAQEDAAGSTRHDVSRNGAGNAVLFAVAVAVSGFTLLRGVIHHDEGLMLQAAARITDGQWPYEDFWWNYGPGQPLVLAALGKIFGPSLLSWRVLRCVLNGLVATMAYRLVRRQASVPFALLAFAAVAGTMAYRSSPGAIPPALALALGALLLAERNPILSGAMTGLAAVFRIEIGLATALGVLFAAGRGRARAVTAAALVTVIAYLPFAIVASPLETLDSTLGFALDEQRLQRLPFPLVYEGPLRPDDLLDFYYPAVLLAGLAAWICAAAVRWPPAIAWGAAPLAAAGAVYLLARTDRGHGLLLAATLPLLLAPAAQAAWRQRKKAWAVLLCIPLAAIVLHGVGHRGAALINPPRLESLRADPADGVRVLPGEAVSLNRLVPFVHERVPPGEPVFVANPRHDMVRVGNPLLYVLLQRSNPTRYDVMQSGVVTTAPIQREIVGDLESARPAIVVRWLAETAERREPNGAGRPTGVRILDGYLTDRYREIQRFGDYAVLSRRE